MEHADLPVLVAGFNAARTRFTLALPGGDESFAAIFETLAWVGAIRDRLREMQRPIPDLLDGLYYVRNLVIHQGADVLDWIYIPGAELGTLVLGVSTLGSTTKRGWWWPLREETPEPRSLTGAKEYDAAVAGREVTEILEQLAAALPHR